MAPVATDCGGEKACSRQRLHSGMVSGGTGCGLEVCQLLDPGPLASHPQTFTRCPRGQAAGDREAHHRQEEACSACPLGLSRVLCCNCPGTLAPILAPFTAVWLALPGRTPKAALVPRQEPGARP